MAEMQRSFDHTPAIHAAHAAFLGRVARRRKGPYAQVVATPRDVTVTLTWYGADGRPSGSHAACYASTPETLSYSAQVSDTKCRVVGTALDRDGNPTHMSLFVGNEDEVCALTAALAKNRLAARTLWQLGVFSDPDVRDPEAFAGYSPTIVALVEEELTLDLAERVSALLAI
jgi:hypothetical protein